MFTSLRSVSRVSRVMTSAVASRGVHIEARIASLGHVLPEPSSPKGNYVSAVRTGNYIYTAGHLPQPAGGELICGKVGQDLTAEEANHAASMACLSLLATIKAQVGDLDRVKRVVKVVGFVNCVDGFKDQPMVINGVSDMLGEIFGDKGKHARSAVGSNALPLNVCVEVEAVFEVEE